MKLKVCDPATALLPTFTKAIPGFLHERGGQGPSLSAGLVDCVLRAVMLPLGASPHYLPGHFIFALSWFSRKICPKAVEKLLILGNVGKVLEKLEGTVLVGITPDHSVRARTC